MPGEEKECTRLPPHNKAWPMENLPTWPLNFHNQHGRRNRQLPVILTETVLNHNILAFICLARFYSLSFPNHLQAPKGNISFFPSIYLNWIPPIKFEKSNLYLNIYTATTTSPRTSTFVYKLLLPDVMLWYICILILSSDKLKRILWKSKTIRSLWRRQW